MFLQENEDDIGLIKDDPINFCQAIHSSNSQKWIDAMRGTSNNFTTLLDFHQAPS
uniref:Uncharacterized protein n=1 Tax=Cajanus cajan TaxID=3821 RepID=A0A151R290_CAJCA|nr:hypothetical protein KK1_042177 [Cajanus cajan]